MEGCSDLSRMLEAVGNIVSSTTGMNAAEVAMSAEKLYRRCCAGFYYEPEEKVKGKILLIRTVENPYQLPDDYDLIKVSIN